MAIMLGRLRMEIDTCISNYGDLADEAFQPKRSKLNLNGRSKDAREVESAFDSDTLAQAIRSIVEESGLPPESKLLEEEPQCKV
jgi:hypothetical protein